MSEAVFHLEPNILNCKASFVGLLGNICLPYTHHASLANNNCLSLISAARVLASENST